MSRGWRLSLAVRLSPDLQRRQAAHFGFGPGFAVLEGEHRPSLSPFKFLTMRIRDSDLGLTTCVLLAGLQTFDGSSYQFARLAV
jgi:hypothetical protein